MEIGPEDLWLSPLCSPCSLWLIFPSSTKKFTAEAAEVAEMEN
jgi:hypothetical protein